MAERIRAGDSHSLQLAVRLYQLGIIKRGSFTWVEFQHDDRCPTLATGSGLDCRCNVEAIVGPRIYPFEELARQAARE